MTPTLLQRLKALKLLNTAAGSDEQVPDRLTALCEGGLLVGGLSVALDVRPDELLGPLAQQMGGTAAQLKILDVRDVAGDDDRSAHIELTVAWGSETQIWPVPGVRALVAVLNAAFVGQPSVRRIVTLGEYRDALQLWCVSRAQLQALERDPQFQQSTSA